MSRKSEPEIKPLVNESALEIKPVYTPADVEASGGTGDIGNPGEFPFTRGIHKYMYRRRPWTMRQYAGFGQPEETNRRFRYLIDNGQTGLNVAFGTVQRVWVPPRSKSRDANGVASSSGLGLAPGVVFWTWD